MNGYELERPCPACAMTTRAETYLCARCRPSTAKRPEVGCWHCERPTTAKSGICRTCCRIPVSARPCAGDELTGGEWVRKGLVYVWLTSPAPAYNGHSMSGPRATMEQPRTRRPGPPAATNGRHWPGSRRPSKAKNGSD